MSRACELYVPDASDETEGESATFEVWGVKRDSLVRETLLTLGSWNRAVFGRGPSAKGAPPT
jgi:hypothetical protein